MATWNGRRVSGDLIEHPVDILEGILRQEYGFGTATIDEAAFDAAKMAMSGWKFAGQLLEQKMGKEVIQDLCRNAALIFYVDPTGQAKVWSMLSRPSVKTLGKEHVAVKSRKTTVASKGLTPLDGVFNEFYLHYNRNYATDEYEDLVFVTKGDRSAAVAAAEQTNCETSYDRYRTIHRWTFESDWIREQATAVKLLTWAVDWFYLRRELWESLHPLDQLNLESGDCVTWSHPLLSGTFLCTNIRPAGKSLVKLSWMEY